jgi:hypothetical protein
MTRHILTAIALILTVGAAVAMVAAAHVSILGAGADTAVATRALCAEIHLILTMFPHPARLAVTAIIIDKLAAVSCSVAIARIRQALINISLTAWPRETRRALAFKSAHPVNTDTAVMTGAVVALVHVDFAEFTAGARRTGAGEAVHQIIAHATVHTGVGLAIVDIMLALCAHVARGAAAAVLRLEVVAGGPVEAGIVGAGIGLMLAVGAPVAVAALAGVRGAHIAALTPVLAQP